MPLDSQGEPGDGGRDRAAEAEAHDRDDHRYAQLALAGRRPALHAAGGRSAPSDERQQRQDASQSPHADARATATAAARDRSPSGRSPQTASGLRRAAILGRGSALHEGRVAAAPRARRPRRGGQPPGAFGGSNPGRICGSSVTPSELELGLDPVHHRAQLLALASRSGGPGLLVAHALEVLLAGAVLGDPLAGELARSGSRRGSSFIAWRVSSEMIRLPRVRSPYSAVLEIEWRIPVMPFSYIRSTISLSSCRHSK